MQLRSGITQKVPPQYDIMRYKERRGREREMHVHEILKQNQGNWQKEEKISNLSVNILGLLEVLVQVSHIPLNLMAYY